MNKDLRKILAFPYIIWMIGFTIIPLSLIFIYGLTTRDGSFTFANVLSIFTRDHFKALMLSIVLSIISTIICLIMAFPLALTLKGKKLDKGSLIVFIFILPMWMNFLLRTLAWLSLLEKNGIINTVLKFMHLPGLNIINTPAAIILGMVYNYLPFMVLPIYNVLEKIDDNTINAARDLGANTLQTIIKVIMPLSIPGIVSGVTMVFVPALTTFVISNILGGSKVLLIGNVIEQEFTKGSNWNLGSGLSLIMMIFILISMAFIAKYDKDGEGMSV